jgi:DNA-binding response OmpR family regulator
MVSSPLAGVRVLLVEDEPLIGMSIEDALARAGAAVHLARTDRDAYAALEETAAGTDLLITDINLREGTTGYDVARFARRLNPAVSVLYLSGGSADSAISFGVDGAEFIAKPVTEAALIASVERIAKSAAPALHQRCSPGRA